MTLSETMVDNGQHCSEAQYWYVQRGWSGGNRVVVEDA